MTSLTTTAAPSGHSLLLATWRLSGRQDSFREELSGKGGREEGGREGDIDIVAHVKADRWGVGRG